MKNIFTQHPHSIGETYLQHLFFASKFGLKMMCGGFACLVHAFIPFLCKKTGSDYLLEMTDDFISRMPVAEERVLSLGRTIDNKKQKTANDSKHA